MNKATYFLLPLIGLNSRSFGAKIFLNTFLSENLDKLIIQLSKPPFQIHSKKYFIRRWDNEYGVFLAYHMPDQFINDVIHFTCGKYSKFSEEAKRLIKGAVIDKHIYRAPTQRDREEYTSQIKNSRHLMSVTFYHNGKLTLLPREIGALEVGNHQARISLTKKLEQELGIQLSETAELYDVPDFTKETISVKYLEKSNV